MKAPARIPAAQHAYAPASTHHAIGPPCRLIARARLGPFRLEAGGRRIVCWRADPSRGGIASLSFMDDACAHRAAPLSAGHVAETDGVHALRCAYHAWAFDRDGRVVHIPSEDRAPCGRVQRTYAAITIGHEVYLTDVRKLALSDT
jgi:nitrite reductase/ring-hydroxylating ferredoxin subunit